MGRNGAGSASGWNRWIVRRELGPATGSTQRCHSSPKPHSQNRERRAKTRMWLVHLRFSRGLLFSLPFRTISSQQRCLAHHAGHMHPARSECEFEISRSGISLIGRWRINHQPRSGLSFFMQALNHPVHRWIGKRFSSCAMAPPETSRVFPSAKP